MADRTRHGRITVELYDTRVVVEDVTFRNGDTHDRLEFTGWSLANDGGPENYDTRLEDVEVRDLDTGEVLDLDRLEDGLALSQRVEGAVLQAILDAYEEERC